MKVSNDPMLNDKLTRLSDPSQVALQLLQFCLQRSFSGCWLHSPALARSRHRIDRRLQTVFFSLSHSEVVMFDRHARAMT